MINAVNNISNTNRSVSIAQGMNNKLALQGFNKAASNPNINFRGLAKNGAVNFARCYLGDITTLKLLGHKPRIDVIWKASEEISQILGKELESSAKIFNLIDDQGNKVKIEFDMLRKAIFYPAELKHRSDCDLDLWPARTGFNITVNGLEGWFSKTKNLPDNFSLVNRRDKRLSDTNMTKSQFKEAEQKIIDALNLLLKNLRESGKGTVQSNLRNFAS